MFSFSRYLTREHGSMSLETVIVFPMLLWAFGATFLFWDAFHAQAETQSAAYTIADLLSREENTVDATYLTGLQKMQNYLIQGKMATRLRVTTIDWNETKKQYEVIWSRTPDTNWRELNDTTLNEQAARIPKMSSGDIAILVETQARYIPWLNVGVGTTVMENFVVTRPRNGPQLIWKNADGTEIGYGTNTTTTTASSTTTSTDTQG